MTNPEWMAYLAEYRRLIELGVSYRMAQVLAAELGPRQPDRKTDDYAVHCGDDDGVHASCVHAGRI